MENRGRTDFRWTLFRSDWFNFPLDIGAMTESRRIQNRKLTLEEKQKQRQQQQDQQQQLQHQGELLRPQHGPMTRSSARLLETLHEFGAEVEMHGPYRIDCSAVQQEHHQQALTPPLTPGSQTMDQQEETEAITEVDHDTMLTRLDPDAEILPSGSVYCKLCGQILNGCSQYMHWHLKGKSHRRRIRWRRQSRDSIDEVEASDSPQGAVAESDIGPALLQQHS